MTAAPDPRDRWSGFSVYWLLWLVIGFGLPEYVAIRLDGKRKDRVKRTLSSNTRAALGYDSINGRQLDVPFAKTRRLSFVVFMAWFTDHIKIKGSV